MRNKSKLDKRKLIKIILPLNILLIAFIFLGCKPDDDPNDPTSTTDKRIIINIYKYNNNIEYDFPFKFGPPYPTNKAIIDIIQRSHKNTLGDPAEGNYQKILTIKEEEMCGCTRSRLYPDDEIFLELNYSNRTICRILLDEWNNNIGYEQNDPMWYFDYSIQDLCNTWLEHIRGLSVDSQGYSVSNISSNIKAKTITIVLLPWYNKSSNNECNWSQRDAADLEENVKLGSCHSAWYGKFTEEGPIILLFCGEINKFYDNFNGYENDDWPDTGKIVIDKNRFTTRVLSHELCHAFGFPGPEAVNPTTCHDDVDDTEPYCGCCVMNRIFYKYITEATSWSNAAH